MQIDTLIFDLGNVLINWNPRNLYTKIFSDEQELDDFLNNICTMEWHTFQDGGRSPEEGTEELVKQHPQYQDKIRAFYSRWHEMFDGPIEGSVQILKELKAKGFRLYAISNWNAELYKQTTNDFPFLDLFDGKIISGEVGMKKPDEEIYLLLLDRFNINPQKAFFVDDNKANVATAKRLGIESLVFTGPEELRNEFVTRKIL